jgi:flagellar FliL protein
MAKEEVAAESVAPKPKGKMLIILALVGVLVIGGGIGAFLLLTKPAAEEHADQDGEESAAADDADDGKDEAPVYVKLEAFTVNLADQESYLQTEIQLLVADAKVGAKMNARLPEVRDAMIRLLSSKTAEELAQQEGKDKLALEIQTQINALLGFKDKLKGVRKVLFGAFIIQ